MIGNLLYNKFALTDMVPPETTWEAIEQSYAELPEPVEGELALLATVQAIEAQLARDRLQTDECKELQEQFPRAWSKATRYQVALSEIPRDRLTRRPEPRFSESVRQAYMVRFMMLFDRASGALFDLDARYFQQTGQPLGWVSR